MGVAGKKDCHVVVGSNLSTIIVESVVAESDFQKGPGAIGASCALINTLSSLLHQNDPVRFGRKPITFQETYPLSHHKGFVNSRSHPMWYRTAPLPQLTRPLYVPSQVLPGQITVRAPDEHAAKSGSCDIPPPRRELQNLLASSAVFLKIHK